MAINSSAVRALRLVGGLALAGAAFFGNLDWMDAEFRTDRQPRPAQSSQETILGWQVAALVGSYLLVAAGRRARTGAGALFQVGLACYGAAGACLLAFVPVFVVSQRENGPDSLDSLATTAVMFLSLAGASLTLLLGTLALRVAERRAAASASTTGPGSPSARGSGRAAR